MSTNVIVVIIIVVIVLIAVLKGRRGSYNMGSASVAEVLSHWSNAFPFFSMSSNDFYSTVEAALRYHEMPNVQIGRALNKEGGIFSASREYLRIMHRDLVFELCAAPYGKDFFVSWWLYTTEGRLRRLLKHTKAGDYLSMRASKRTFFQADQEAMFRSCVHNVVLEVVQKMTEEKGLRGLSDLQKVITEGGL